MATKTPFPAISHAAYLLWAERARVIRILDDIRHARRLAIKRRANVPVLYPLSADHARRTEDSARYWLPKAWRDYRRAQRTYWHLSQEKEAHHAA